MVIKMSNIYDDIQNINAIRVKTYDMNEDEILKEVTNISTTDGLLRCMIVHKSFAHEHYLSKQFNIRLAQKVSEIYEKRKGDRNE